MRRFRRLTLENVLFTTFNTIFMILLMIVTLYPFLNTLAISFNDGMDTVRGGIYLWPREFSLQNYRVIFNTHTIYTAFMNSVTKTLLTMVVNIIATSMLAYTLTRKDFVLNKLITVVFVITMYINAGLIPNYMLVRNLGLINSYWVYILPNVISAFNVIVVRTYMSSLPDSLAESATIDGAGDFTIFLRIIFPLCKPVLATIALFVAVGSWNSWFDNFLYNSAKQHLSTLQYELMKLLQSSMTAGSGTGGNVSISSELAISQITPVSIRAAITIVTAIPILIVYPFVQKHFVVGLTLGGVKG